MSPWLPSIPYPPSSDGFWNPVTSTINWCEEDYYASRYSAEIVNSFTNLWFIYLAYRGITNCIDQDHDRVFLYAWFTYLMIGIGSFIFHTTLKYPMQLLDELSMVYTTCVLFYATFEHGKSTKSKLALLVLTVSIAAFVTGYYHYLGDPVFHQNMFTLLTLIVFLQSLYQMEITLRPSRRPQDEAVSAAEQLRCDARDTQILRIMYKMIPYALGSVGLGFVLWSLDTLYCGTLRSWRHQLGLPYGMILELHGWWHFWTGTAEYCNIVWCTWLRYCLDGKQDEVTLIWPSIWNSLPKLERRKGDRQKRA